MNASNAILGSVDDGTELCRCLGLEEMRRDDVSDASHLSDHHGNLRELHDA